MSALLGANVSSGQDMAYLTIDISMRDLYAIQKEFIQYVNIDELLPKLISKGLLSDNEMYMVKNPYLPPDQRISMLFQYISSKGPKGPSRLVECLTERPLVPGHMYLASRLAGDSKLDASRKGFSPFDEKTNPVVEKKIKDLQFKFADLLLETHRFLKNSTVSVEEVKIFMSFMSASTTNASSLFFSNHLPSLSSASTIDQIFTIVNENRYWNHFNYQLLEAVVRKFGNDKIQDQMEHYKDDVMAFENSVSLSEYSANVSQKETISSKPDFTPVRTTLKAEKNWDTYSLSEARALQKKMCGELDIQSHSLLFQSAEEGSVVITWLVPVSIQYSVLVHCKRRRKRLCQIGIHSFEVAGTVVLMNKGSNNDYENLSSVIFDGKSNKEELSAILHSLDSVETAVNKFSSELKSHRQAIAQKMYGKPSLTVGAYSELQTLPLITKRSSSSPTPIPALRKDMGNPQNGKKPVAKPRSPKSSPHSVFPPPEYIPAIRAKSLTLDEQTREDIRKTQSLIRRRELRLESKDDSDEEDREKWIDNDSGYSDPNVWTKS